MLVANKYCFGERVVKKVNSPRGNPGLIQSNAVLSLSKSQHRFIRHIIVTNKNLGKRMDSNGARHGVSTKRKLSRY